MKKIFASTFNRKIYYDFGGKRFLESYISTKQTTPLYVFVEGDLKVHTKGWPKHENITYLNLLEEDKKTWENFLESKKQGFDVNPVFTRGSDLKSLDRMYEYDDYVFIGFAHSNPQTDR